MVDVPLIINNCVSWPTTIICTLCVYAIGIYHITKSSKWLRSSSNLNRSQAVPRIDVYFSFIMLLVSGIYLPILINMTYSETVSLDRTYCTFVVFSCTGFYTAFKTSVYIVMVLRLRVISNDKAVVNYSTKWLGIVLGNKCMYILYRILHRNKMKSLHQNVRALIPQQGIWTFVLCAWALGSNTLSAFTTNAYIDEHSVCAFEWSAPFLVSVVLNDMSAGVVFGYLFINPILIMSRKVTGKGQHQKGAALKMKHVAVKQFLLSIVASGSTLVVVLFVYLFHLTQV